MKSALVCLTLLVTTSFGRAAEPQLDPEVDQGLTQLRDRLLAAYNQGDIDAMLKLVTDDVVVTWQNAEVCRGPEAVRQYYERIVKGPNKVVTAATAKPEITGRHMHDGWGISWGLMNDQFTLTDGTPLDMHSHFTAVVQRVDDAWRIAAFHVSVNAFDNAVLQMAIHKTLVASAAISGVVALIVGWIAGRAIKRGAPAPPAT